MCEDSVPLIKRAWVISRPLFAFGLPSGILPNFAKPYKAACMSTMNISLPDTLKSFVDEQVSQRGYGTSSEYVRALIR